MATGSRRWFLGAVAGSGWLAACAGRPYDHPVTGDSQQPDRMLFDKAVEDIEKGRYERARLTLQTLMNTYPDSEYLAEAERAMEETWRREGKTPKR